MGTFYFQFLNYHKNFHSLDAYLIFEILKGGFREGGREGGLIREGVIQKPRIKEKK